ncbi:MAG: preprotein translocase subunit SecE [Thiotrichales bacterium]|nr:preprotein translocase subunit SecE [Thiotrichales bacterium]
MNSKVETVSGVQETIKLLAALLIILAAVVGFYVYTDESTLVRVLALLGATGVSIFIALQTQKGRNSWSYLQDTQLEVRKVVWPTRQETIQTTLLVILMVVIVAIFLWLLDMFLGWSIGSLMGRGG